MYHGRGVAMSGIPDDREERFCALYDGARPRIISYVLRRTSSREDAADIVAETFEIAWRRLEEVPDGESGLLWLFVTARNVLANHGRRLQRREHLVARLAQEFDQQLARVDALDEEAMVMESCFKTLDDDDRELLMLAGWDGLSATEIGKVLECSATAARIRLHRARARLKGEMAAHSEQTSKHSGHVGHERDGSTERLGVNQEVQEP
jgi:RNA polymerase sigma-70 factor (ECF subfamily)